MNRKMRLLATLPAGININPVEGLKLESPHFGNCSIVRRNQHQPSRGIKTGTCSELHAMPHRPESTSTQSRD